MMQVLVWIFFIALVGFVGYEVFNLVKVLRERKRKKPKSKEEQERSDADKGGDTRKEKE